MLNTNGCKNKTKKEAREKNTTSSKKITANKQDLN